MYILDKLIPIPPLLYIFLTPTPEPVLDGAWPTLKKTHTQNNKLSQIN